MKLTKSKKRKGFTLVELLVVISIIAVLAGIAVPLILRAQKEGKKIKAIANAKSVAAGLMSFKDERGGYPSASTREILEQDGIDYLPEGKSSNAYLAQLIVTNTIDSEKSFFADGVLGAREGDDIKGSADKLLERGECGFSYIMAEDEKPLRDASSYTPLIIAPVREGGDNPTFDGDPFGDKYVMGLADGSASAGEIDEEGHAVSKGRETFFQTGRDSLFGNDKTELKLPLGAE